MQRRIMQYIVAATAIFLVGKSTLAGAGPYTELGLEIADMNAWVTAVKEVIRGPIDYLQPELGDATFGVEDNVIGEIALSTGNTLSLGDGGSITASFDSGISDGDGVDFAVFENGIMNEFGLFAEFGFVDVSSDGVAFAGFEAQTVRTTPVAPFEEIDGTDYYNLAGDQPLGLGTGFDLAELAAHPLVLSGDVDLSNIRYVRVSDVIGDGVTFDANSNPIYDPYSTPFATGGFDLNGIGVIHVPEPTAAHSLSASASCCSCYFPEAGGGAAHTGGAAKRSFLPADSAAHSGREARWLPTRISKVSFSDQAVSTMVPISRAASATTA